MGSFSLEEIHQDSVYEFMWLRWEWLCLWSRQEGKKMIWCLHCCWVQETSLVQIKSIVSFKSCHHSNVYFSVSDPGPFRSFSTLVYFVSVEGSGLMAQMVQCMCVCVIPIITLPDKCDLAVTSACRGQMWFCRLGHCNDLPLSVCLI